MSRATPTIDIHYDGDPGSIIITGFAEHGLAGLTAVDYLVDKLELEPAGHVEVTGIPSITPFENGTPRNHSRLFSGPDAEFTVLVGELLVPDWISDRFARSLYEWASSTGIEELALCSGVPFVHGPDDHKPFYVATGDYQERRLGDTDLTPMTSGYLDGINGSIMMQGVNSDIATCLFTTPAHPQSPDVEAALRILDALTQVYGIELDTEPLETFASEVQQYYSELAQRVERAGEEQAPDDRMYM